ncbi:MAG: MFS transporter [Chloroflexi bacterium]|nr:MFS transporter [Chloroflexota bacterium]
MTTPVPVQVAPRPRVFYGWWVAAVAGLVNLIATGVLLQTLGVFIYPLEREFGWTRAQLSLANSVAFVVAGIAGPFVGRLNDRHGSRPLMLAGAAIMGFGVVSLAWLGSLWQLYLGYAVGALGRNATGYISLGALVSNWFSRRRGLALGIATGGGSLGGVIIVPLATALIAAFGWRTAWLLLGLLAWVVALPAVALVVRSRPADLGLTPDGLPDVTLQRAVSAGRGDDWTASRAFRTVTFWLLTVTFGCGFASQIALGVHLVPYLIGEGLTPVAAAAFASMAYLFTAAGRFLSGWVADAFGSPRRVVAAALALQAGGLAILVGAGPFSPLVWLFFICNGLGGGAPAALEPALVAESFGLRALGGIMGVIGIFMSAALVAAPVLAGLAYDLNHSYTVAFSVLAGLSLVAALAALLNRPALRPAGSAL